MMAPFRSKFFISFSALLTLGALTIGFAFSAEQQQSSSVEITGDQVEYIMEESKMIAVGNVVIAQQKMRLTCDRVEFSRNTKVAVAQGHVVLTSPQGTISGDKMVYNFEAMTGELVNARISSAPYYGAGKSLTRVDAKKIEMLDGYLTSCDLDKPHFRMLSKKIEVFPGDKAVARNLRLVVGKVPLMYIPQYTQIITDKKPRVLYTPGYHKDWGAFLLQAWRYNLNENLKGVLHLDYREKKGFAPGLDVKYIIPRGGEGIVRLYYMNELNIQRNHFWNEKTGKTIARERFKAEWRHKWQVDEQTNVVAQYYKLSDDTFLKDYF